jgi:fibronectin-binding autotransporter adhesin
MNKSYRTLWNAHTQAWVAVSEITRGRGKRSGSSVVAGTVATVVLAAGLSVAAPPAWAACTTTGTVIDCTGASPAQVLLTAGQVVNNSGVLGVSKMGFEAVFSAADGVTVNNNGGTVLGENSIDLTSGGSVTNKGAITALHTGIIVDGKAGTVQNLAGGSIEGTTGYGVEMLAGGTVTNTGNSSIVSKAAAAVGVAGDAQVTNEKGSTISGIGFAVLTYGGNAKISNAGQMTASVQQRDGIGEVTLFTGGKIDGDLSMANVVGSKLTLDGTGGQVYSQAVTGTTTFSGDLVKQGTGTWTLDKSLAARSVAINEGTLAAGAANVLPNTAGVTVTAAAELDLGGFNQSIGSLAGVGNVTLGSAALTVTGSGGASTVYAGIASGSGSLALTGGTLELTGSNSFAGGLSITKSTLRAGSDGVLGAPGAKISIDDGTLQVAAPFTLARDVFVTNIATIDTNGSNLTMTGALRDSGVFGTFVKEGLGTLTLQSAASDYANGTFVNGGTLALQGAGTLGSYRTAVASGATLDISQATSGASAKYISGSGTIDLGGKTLTTSNASSTTQFDGVIRDGGIAGGTGGALHITDAGSWTLTKAQQYTGGTALDAGTLTLTGNGALASGTSLAMGAAAHFDVSATAPAALTLGDLSGAGAVALGDKALTLGTANNTNFAGAIDGAGASLVKQGTGNLVLDGINTYTGLTTVDAGRLVVGSNAAHAYARVAGAVSVASGATLGGHGSIGGNVAVASGAHLAPGNSIGALSVAGDLSLANGSVLDFEFGAPGSSDSVTVGGNLALNGAKLNVIDTGTLGVGVYNLFSYGGTLTQSNGGIALGSVPAGSFTVEYLAGSKQVNLISVGAGQVLNYWNGNRLADASRRGGGDGTWSVAQPSWTDAKGSVTSAMQPQPGFAVFGGAAGKVVVDSTGGAVSATGIQFASDGYKLSGDTLTLVADKSTPGPVELRVGDGSAASAGWKAGIANVVAGSDGVVKTGDGTLVLSAANTYTGGTAVRGGTLEISDNANLGANTNALTLDAGALRIASGLPFTLTHALTLGAGGGTLDVTGALVTIDQAVDGAGGLSVTGAAGTLNVSAPNTYAGTTTLQGGARVNVIGAGTFGAGSVGQAGNNSTLQFLAGTSAGTNTYTLARAGTADSNNLMVFSQDATAASSKLFVNGAGWQAGGLNSLNFTDASTAASATITNRGGAVIFQDAANAGSATISNGDKSELAFRGASTAGTAQISNQSGGTVFFANTATGAKAVIGNAAGGTLDVSGVTSKAGIELGAVSGGGAVVLGATRLTVGGLGTSDTLSGNVSGAGGAIVKVGTGALTLSGTNTYTGGTALQQGRLNLGSSQALGTGALSMDDDTTLGFSADGVNIANAIQLTGANDPVIDTGAFSGTLSGAISGGGFITKQGTGTLTLAGANTYTGATNVAQGTLRAGAANTFSAASAHSVAAGATLDLAGFNQTVASLANGGTVSLSGATAGTTLTVNGNYVGTNGVLKIGTALNGIGPSDRLVVSGGTATGRTSVQVANLGGLGALTGGNGIEVVSAQNGATTTAQTTRDAFSLAGGHVDAGAYEYRLFAADANGAGENWYLRSTTNAAVPPTAPNAPAAPVVTYRPEASLYAALPSQLRQGNLAMLGDLRKRVGDDDVKGAATPTSTDMVGSGRRAWARVLSTDIDVRQGGTVSPSSKGRLTGFQAGTDLLATPNWRAGLYVGQLDGDARVNGFASGIQNLGVGTNDLRSQYVGIYGTYTADNGFYADAVVQSGRHRYTVQPSASLGAEGKGHSLLGSIEVGQAFALGGGGWRIEPQLQLIHQHMDLNDAAIAGAIAQPQADSGWIARAGVRIKGEIDTGMGTLQPYGRVNVYRTSGGADIARFVNGAATTDISAPTGGTSTELAGGFTLALGQATSLYGEIGKLWASGGNARVKSSVNGSLGVRVKW